MRFQNTDTDSGTRPRTWNTLVNAETLTTLELAPGEAAEVLEWRDLVDEQGNPVGVELAEPAPDAAFPFLVRAEVNSRTRKPAASEPASDNPQPIEE